MNKDVNYWFDNKQMLLEEYRSKTGNFKKILKLLLPRFENLLIENKIKGSIHGRIKKFDAFHKKLLIKCQRVTIQNPCQSITDIIGLRIIVPFLQDVELVESLIKEKFNVIEIEHKSQALSIREFGYDSTHLLIEIRYKTNQQDSTKKKEQIIVEIQLRTILQDAWAEVEHELIYKTSIDKVEDTIRRKLLAINASLSLADITFQEIRDYHNTRFRELQIKHKKLIDKVSTIPEKMADNALAESLINSNISPQIEKFKIDSNYTINTMFIDAVNSHINNDFERAVELYTQLIKISPNHYLYNHRGLVYIAISEYDKAIQDFTKAIEIKPEDIRVYTNRGLAHRMLKEHNEALIDFNKSLELNPLWPDTLYGRSLTYYDLGDIKKAIEDCEKAISLKPDFKQAGRFMQYLLNITFE